MDILFKKGLKENLPSISQDGTFYITEDTKEIFLGLNGNIEQLSKNIVISDSEPIDAEVGTLWIDTGEEGEEGGNSTSITLDTTLTQEGMAADAKAVGDRFVEVDSSIEGLATQEYVDTVVDNISIDTSTLVQKSGDMMTGDLTIQGQMYPALHVQPLENSTTNSAVFEGNFAGAASMAAYEDATGNNRRMLEVRNRNWASDNDNALLMRTFTNGDIVEQRVYWEGQDTPIPLNQIDVQTTTSVTSGSSALVTSGGVYTALSNIDVDGYVPIDGGTMEGALVADAISVRNLTLAQMRNIWAGTADISEVENSLREGDIYLRYKEG